MKGLKKGLILLYGILYGMFADAQPVIHFNIAAVRQSFNGLYQFSVVNPEQATYESFFEVVLEDQEGKAVLTISSGKVLVRPGNNLVSLTGGNVRSKKVGAGVAGRFLQQTGRLPNGSYNYCVEAEMTDRDKGTNRSVFKCFPFDVLRPSELHLVLPDNGDSICNSVPVLQWQPLLPMVAGTEYSLRMVLLKDGETPGKAIASSYPLVYREGIRTTSLPFSQTGKRLSKGDRCAWQVYATLNGVLLASSEVWTFTYGCDDPVDAPVRTDHLLLSSLTNHLYYESDDGKVPLSFFNPYAAEKLKYEIKDLSETQKKLSNFPVIPLTTGFNKVLFDLNEVDGVSSGGYYEMRISGMAEDVLVIKIKIR